jgi:hypothetical protein
MIAPNRKPSYRKSEVHKGGAAHRRSVSLESSSGCINGKNLVIPSNKSIIAEPIIYSELKSRDLKILSSGPLKTLDFHLRGTLGARMYVSYNDR